MKSLHSIFLFCLFLGFTACNNDDEQPEPVKTEFTGPKVNVGDGQAWAYIRTDEQQKPLAIGVQFDEAALTNLPSGSPHGDEFVLELPTDISVAPYNHITLDWNEHGHDPMHVYDLPHFDLHFYFMSMEQRDAISPFDSTEFNKPLAPEYLAPMYLETPGGVPRMGAHIIDLTSPEIAGTGTFTHTFIYGKYDAKINFLEPMITKAFLESKKQVHQEIRQPQAWQKTGYYPAQYTIQFDETTKTYSVLLEDLVQQ
jgi:hypothetical protein